jgi:general secretion pathway protein A
VQQGLLVAASPSPGVLHEPPPLADSRAAPPGKPASLSLEAPAGAGSPPSVATERVEASATVPASEPPPSETAPAAPGVIAGPAQQDHWLHEAMAVRSLFDQWQIEVQEPTALDDACRRVGQMGLYCLQMSDGLAALRTLNSPAIVELRQADGPDFLATLLALEQDRARLAVAGTLQEVPLDSLVRQWNGRYTLLWRAPQGWTRKLGLGVRSPAVAWIDRRLAQWEGIAPRGSADNLFTAELAQRVRNFQRAHGLKEDGVVGQMTMAHLAALTDPEAPALAQQAH